MREVITKVYTFNELSEDAKKKAIENQREWEYSYSEPLIGFQDDCEQQAKDKGFIDIKIQYSLSYSQGDGLSFSAENYDNLEEIFNQVLGKGKEKTAKLLAENCSVKITGNQGHYCYASASDIDLEIENYTSSINCTNIDRIDDVANKVLKLLETLYVDFCKDLEKQGYSQLEYYYSDEAIKETIECNEYEFTEDGKQF